MRPDGTQQATGAVAAQPPFLTRARRVDERPGHLHHQREAHLADRACVDELLHFLSRRRIAELVVDRVHDAGPLGHHKHLASLGAIPRHRLLADHVLARGESRQSVFAMQSRWRCDAYDIDVVAADESADRIDRDGDAGLLGGRAGAIEMGRADRRDLESRGAEAGDLNARSEPGPHDPHPQRHSRTV